MELTEEAADAVTIVAVAGRLDALAARQLGDRLTTLTSSGRSHLLIDASRLEYIGSLGLRALLVATRLAAEADGRLVLCNLTAPVRRVIDLGGFADCFEAYASRDEAMAKLSAA
jgi:stage II sporulation protein AA (anti-sigma F factor antagonist)